MKRPAESQLTAEGRPEQPQASNPFAGVSLLGGGGASTLGFSSSSGASSGGNPFAGVSLLGGGASAGGGFFSAAASSATSGTGFGTAAPSAPASTTKGDSNGKADNPFMGLSLFSTPAASGGGGLFTAAASNLPQSPGTLSGKAEDAKSGAGVENAPDSGTTAATTSGGDEEHAEEGAGSQEQPEGGEEEDAVTGEEHEEVIFRQESKLFKLVKHDGPPGSEAKQDEAGSASASQEDKGWRWQERGTGIVHINRHKKTGAGRLVMRMKGVLKLLLNTPVFPTTKYEKVGQKSVRFVGVDTDSVSGPEQKGEVALSALRLNLGSGDNQAKFLAVVKDITTTAK